MVKKIEVLEQSPATLEGVRFIGVSTGVTCYIGERQLHLLYERSLEQTFGVETSTGKEFNWGASLTVGATTGVEIFGGKAEVEVSATGSIGGSRSWIRTEQRSTTTGSSTTTSQYYAYTGPGSALAYGYVNIYKVNRNAVPCRYHVVCDSGMQMTKEATIKLQSTSYGMSHFGDVVYRFNKAKCEEAEDCIHALDGAKALNNLNALKQQFIDCFANGIGYPAARK